MNRSQNTTKNQIWKSKNTDRPSKEITSPTEVPEATVEAVEHACSPIVQTTTEPREMGMSSTEGLIVRIKAALQQTAQRPKRPRKFAP